MKQVLEHTVKPIFRASNPHPHIDPATGRSLPPSRIARLPQQGGLSSLTQDFFDGEGQRWKESVGLGAVIYWCIDSISPDVYHDAWHLAVPPLMTLLDDYQARYKLWGLLIAGRMLRSVPPSLLHKTGIDGLLKTVRIHSLYVTEQTSDMFHSRLGRSSLTKTPPYRLLSFGFPSHSLSGSSP